MTEKFLVFSIKKPSPTFIFIEDLYNNDNESPFTAQFLGSSHLGLNSLVVAFPNIKFVVHNCFYARELGNFRISIMLIIRQVKLFAKGLLQGFFVEFKLVGLGFKVKKGGIFGLKNIRFDIGFSHFTKIAFSPVLKFVRGRKRFLIFSHDYFVLTSFIKNVQNIRKHNPYKTRGLKIMGLKVRTKPGKKQAKR